MSTWAIPLSMMRKGVCMPAIWFSPISVSSNHQPGFEAFISRVLNEPKIGSKRENYKLSDYQINIVVELSKNLKVTRSYRGEFKSDSSLLRPDKN